MRGTGGCRGENREEWSLEKYLRGREIFVSAKAEMFHSEIATGVNIAQ